MWCIVDEKTHQVLIQSREISDLNELWVLSPSDVTSWFRASGRDTLSSIEGIQITLLTNGLDCTNRTLAAHNHAHVHELEESRRLAFELDWATAKWEHLGAALRSVSPLLLSTWREVGIKWNIGAAAVENFSAQLWSQFVPDGGISGELLQTWCDKRDRLLQRGGDLYDITVSSLDGMSLGERNTDSNTSKRVSARRKGTRNVVNSSATVISFVDSAVSGKEAKRLRTSHVVVAVNGRSVASLSCSKIVKLLQHSSFPIKLRLRDTSWSERAPGERYSVKLPKQFHDTGICWGDSDLHPGLLGNVLRGFRFVVSPAKHAGMIIGDLLLSVNNVPLTGISFPDMCRRVAESSRSPIRRFLVRRKAQAGPLRFDLPQGHLGINFDRQTLQIVTFQNVPGVAQLAIPRIGIGDILERINDDLPLVGDGTGKALDAQIVAAGHSSEDGVVLTFRDRSFDFESFHTGYGSSAPSVETAAHHLLKEWWFAEIKLSFLRQALLEFGDGDLEHGEFSCNSVD
jgi:hypothetical protein